MAGVGLQLIQFLSIKTVKIAQFIRLNVLNALIIKLFFYAHKKCFTIVLHNNSKKHLKFMNVTFNYYLRKNSQNKSGEFPIYLRITKNRKHKYVSTGISVPEKYWNPRNQDIRKSHRDYRSLNKLLKNKMSRAKNIYAELSSDGEVTAKSIVDRLKSSRRADFFEVADELAEELKVKKKYYQSKRLR